MSTRAKIHGWDCIVLNVGNTSIAIAPKAGGRIVSLAQGCQEFLFTDPESRGSVLDTAAITDLTEFKRGRAFPITGGNKTWIAPQSGWTYGLPPVDLDSGEYSVLDTTNTSVTLESPICRETGVQIRRQIELPSPQLVRLSEAVTNRSDDPLNYSAWSVTQLLRPSFVFVRGTLNAFRPYDFSQSKPLWTTRTSQIGQWIRFDVNAPGEFKFGGLAEPLESSAESGITAILLARPDEAGGSALLGMFFRSEPLAHYAHDASFEIYNHPSREKDYFEAELHAPMRTLAPGESSMLEQKWVLGETIVRTRPDRIGSKELDEVYRNFSKYRFY